MELERLEHLKMVQGVISRMAQNSFLIKGWSVTLTVGVLAGAAASKDPRLALLALLPALVFWGLDAFYLRQERLFRALHENICAAFGKDPVTFSLDTKGVRHQATSWLRTLCAKTVFWLHAPLIASIVFISVGIQRTAAKELAACVAKIFTQ